MNIDNLALKIAQVHELLYKKAVAAVNISLTVRNWLIGYYIVEYEQNGEDRAVYGNSVLKKLSIKLKEQRLKNVADGELRKYRAFYKVYPHFSELLIDNQSSIRGTLYRELQLLEFRGAVSRELQDKSILIPAEKIIAKLSYSHFEEFVKIENPLKRAFYEIECINGTWSTRELERQINSLYFERSGLSTDKIKLSELANRNAETLQAADLIRNPLTFEFLGLPLSAIIEEDKLEKALIDNLQSFLLELGNGFCFEARQKRILIDDEYFYIDLVFYHRILKCHIIVEIKTDEFTHENIGQLKVYLEYFKEEIMQQTDNPPVGILLCTKSKKNMVRYAIAGNEQLFVSEYRLQLPSESEIQAYVESKIQTL
ncbi:MAG TPA: hypothetical protein DCQ31_10880 [Bacteroidales bacterium]|nr:hypothetical protein [Bacteroidales bacterium]